MDRHKHGRSAAASLWPRQHLLGPGLRLKQVLFGWISKLRGLHLPLLSMLILGVRSPKVKIVVFQVCFGASFCSESRVLQDFKPSVGAIEGNLFSVQGSWFRLLVMLEGNGGS